MTQVDLTELSYSESDSVCLDFYLGNHNGNKEAWAKRVWNNCKLYIENNGLDLDGNKLPLVYGRDVYVLWEEKKRRRRAAFVKESTGEECDPKLLNPENIRKDLEEKKECKWPNSHSAESILKIKEDPKNNYKTATEKYLEDKAIELEKIEKLNEEIALNVSRLQSKFDNETIAIIYPQGAGLL